MSDLGEVTTRQGKLDYLPAAPTTTVAMGAADPLAVGPGHHALEAPATTPVPPGYRTVDVSTREWDGSAASLGEPGREGATVPRALADYLVQQKAIAAAQVRDHTVWSPDEGDPFNPAQYLPTLRAATQVGRDALAQGRAERVDAQRFGVSERQLEALDANQAAPIARTKAAIRDAVTTVATKALTALAQAERVATRELASAGVQPTEQDYAGALDLRQTLDLMPPSIAVPLLRGILVEQPARTGKNVGRVVAVLPLLRAKHQTDPAWNNSPDADALITECELVTRNAEWYRAHMRLSRIHELQYKVQSLTGDYAANYGDERAWGYAARDAGFYAELGVGA